MSLKVTQISKIYGRQRALDQVSFSVKSGEIIGLLGPNGAGKSTLMKILTCFIPPTSGEASVCGLNVLDHSLEVRRKVGYLPENNPLYHDMYVKEFLLFIAGIHQLGSKKSKRVSEMIELTGLQIEQNKKIGMLSKGYRQRVGLASAIIHNPEVLILDEPTSGLDPNQIVEIRQLISEIGRSKTVMLSTHILQEVEAVCSRAIIIHKGKLVADELTSNLPGMFRQAMSLLVEFGNEVSKKNLMSIEGITDAMHIKERQWELVCLEGSDPREAVFNFASGSHNTILSLQKKEQASIQDVFSQLTRK